MEKLQRDLSWLEFNARVLAQATDARTPLLERLRFLSIFSSNLDEFFMKRIGGFKQQIAAGVENRVESDQSPARQISMARARVMPMLESQAKTFLDEIKPELELNRVRFVPYESLAAGDRERIEKFYRTQVFPVLTPLAVDPAHPFPFISNLSTSFGVFLKHPEHDETLFARLKVPNLFPQWIRIESPENTSTYSFVSLSEVIEAHIDELFDGMQIVDVMPFRITRSAELERDEDDSEDLLEMIQEELRERRFAPVVRLEHGPQPNLEMLQLLTEELDLHADDIYEVPSLFDYTAFKTIIDLNLPRLKYESWSPITPLVLSDEDRDIFGVIRENDLLVHHPFESFASTVERFVRSAAEDPNVLAIKMTLYRTGDNSSLIDSLIRAAEQGKQVVCLVELKARFDEHRNIRMAQILENAGVHVVYGIVGMKTHCKLALVIRREDDQSVRSYVHIGTGNYHPQNARLYTDLGLFTDNDEITADVAEIFHLLTGRSLRKTFRKLLVAPINLKEQLLAKIEREIEHSNAGQPARIIAKMNSLYDNDVIAALYRASQAGVVVDLIVRGFCTLVPQVKGMSDHIRVISIIGRFLEHSRVFYFRNGESDSIEGEFFIGSADWMTRNLSHRIEVVAPIESRENREKLWEILESQLEDRRLGWEMRSDGSYVQRMPEDDEKDIGSHALFMNLTRQRSAINWEAEFIH